MSNENKPVHRIRISSIAASIFKNKSEDGNVSYNVYIDRSYKDGDEWKQAKGFRYDDLTNLEKVVKLSDSWIYSRQQADMNQSPEPT